MPKGDPGGYTNLDNFDKASPADRKRYIAERDAWFRENWGKNYEGDGYRDSDGVFRVFPEDMENIDGVNPSDDPYDITIGHRRSPTEEPGYPDEQGYPEDKYDYDYAAEGDREAQAGADRKNKAARDAAHKRMSEQPSQGPNWRGDAWVPFKRTMNKAVDVGKEVVSDTASAAGLQSVGPLLEEIPKFDTERKGPEIKPLSAKAKDLAAHRKKVDAAKAKKKATPDEDLPTYDPYKLQKPGLPKIRKFKPIPPSPEEIERLKENPDWESKSKKAGRKEKARLEDIASAEEKEWMAGRVRAEDLKTKSLRVKGKTGTLDVSKDKAKAKRLAKGVQRAGEYQDKDRELRYTSSDPQELVAEMRTAALELGRPYEGSYDVSGTSEYRDLTKALDAMERRSKRPQRELDRAYPKGAAHKRQKHEREVMEGNPGEEFPEGWGKSPTSE